MSVPTEKHVNLSDDAIGTYFNTRPTCFTKIALQQYEICFVMSWYRTMDVHDFVSSVIIYISGVAVGTHHHNRNSPCFSSDILLS
jgi:hypothetical protein